LRIKADASPGVTPIDLQYARLNDGHLTLSVEPRLGSDQTDGRVTILGGTAAASSVAAAWSTNPLEPAMVSAALNYRRLPMQPPQTPPPFGSGGYVAPTLENGAPPAPVPVIDFAGSFSLPTSVGDALRADGRSKSWLKDYLANAGQAHAASPNAGLKVRLPVSPTVSAAASSGVRA
jgi:hypothetical protein